MEVRCDKCQARYRVDDARIGPQGLTMRCGKCQNTFKVSRQEPLPTMRDMEPVAPAAKPAPAAMKPAAAKPAPRPAEPPANATMVFGQSPVAAAKPAMPAAAKALAAAKPPAAVRPASAAGPAAPAAPADEGAGRTMMFQTGNLKSSPGATGKPEPAGAAMVMGQPPVSPVKPAANAKPAARSADPEAGATMVFGQSPAAKAAAKPAAAKPSPTDDVAGSTMMFNAAPQARPATPAKPAPAPAPVAEPEPPHAAQAPADGPVPEAASPAEEPPQAEAAAHEKAAPDEETGDSEAEAGESGEAAEAEEGTFDKAPPKGLLIGVAAGLVVLLIAGGALFAVRKLGRHAPPPAAVETLSAAQNDADKDSLAAIASAEAKARDALDAAGPRSAFPEGPATLARIEIQWADALNDEANALAARNADDPKAVSLQAQARGKLKSAQEILNQALKADDKAKDSAELQLALADYARAQRLSSSMNKALKAAQSLQADDARVALVQGMALLQDEDGAEKAIPRLKAALSAAPQSARIHYRLALAYQAIKDDANASTELKETMKISPQHERAKLALESAASADGK